MGLAGISLNLISLGGIALGIGMLVNNAIVVLENINQYRLEGLSHVSSVVKGAKEVSRAITVSTLTTISAFLPPYIHKGIAGKLFFDQAFAMTVSLLVSLIVSLTVVVLIQSWKKSYEVDETKPVKQNAVRWIYQTVYFRFKKVLRIRLFAPRK